MAILNECIEKMDKTLSSLKDSFGTLRAGRVSPGLLDKVIVNVYDSNMPLKHVASITVASATDLVVKPFDPSTAKDILSGLNKADLGCNPVVNGGVIVKYSANQKYTTDAVMGSYVRDLMQRRSIPFQIFVNNSDVTGGSTLGNLSAHQLSIPCADVGLAQLAMHSSWESAGVADCRHILDLFRAYLEDREVEHAK